MPRPVPHTRGANRKELAQAVLLRDPLRRAADLVVERLADVDVHADSGRAVAGVVARHHQVRHPRAEPLDRVRYVNVFSLADCCV